ncbi:probable serine/threonine-protein kinase PBL2 [Rutidosis leptorrhynchoides]|uniref:probable serine/threonine-protein kinase PBL2 n=1 Tax=Rutidosis leptorrhynchoides TaxID=125765 RepID=UPI003A99697A
MDKLGVGIALGITLIIIIVFICFCTLQSKSISNTSESASSNCTSHDIFLFGPPGERNYTMEELRQATNQFNETNLIGHGSFGLVYKALLSDALVAIKLRPGTPKQEFAEQVSYLSGIRHRHLVSLLGCCQDNGSVLLVFEYQPNGSICNHLYEESSTKVDFKQRLLIALGAAKGLCHLHSLDPPIVHKNFKTANVLVDQDFTAKVSDAGVSILLENIQEQQPGPPPFPINSPFLIFILFISFQYSNPNQCMPMITVGQSGTFTKASDVYTFGVFLLELVTGQEAVNIAELGSFESLILWVRSQLNTNKLVDKRLGGRFTRDGIIGTASLSLLCMNCIEARRPKMEEIVMKIEQIHEREITLVGEGNTTFTLGSHLFTQS